MPEYTLNRNDDAVQLFRGTLKGNGINPLFFARDIKTSLSVGGENDLDAALIDLAAKVADHTAEGSIRSELLQLAEFNRYRGDWKAAAYRVNDEIFSTDNHFYVRLTAGTDTSSDTAPTATTAEWRKVANGTLEDEIITFHKRIQEDHKIFVDDWGTHSVGTEYKVGDIVKRYVQWFICEEPHVKGAVGPDNDADRWSPITNFAGDYDGTRWYHAGVYVIYNNRITHALEDITPSDPAPDHADNTKWEWNAASSSGGFNTEWTNANAINLTAFGDFEFASGNLTELVVGKPNLIAFDGNATLTDGDSQSRGNNVRVQIQINGGEWVDLTPQININGETNAAHVIRTAAAVAIWPTTETEPFKLRFHSNRTGTTGTLAAGARLLQEEAIGTVDLGTIYHTNEEIIKGGAGIHVTADDDAETLTINADQVGPAVPAPPTHVGTIWGRVSGDDLATAQEVATRQLASHDTRLGGAPYSYQFTYARAFTSGHGVHQLRGWRNNFPDNPDDYDDTRPGFLRDGNDNTFNHNGVDYANTADRRSRIRIDIKTNNTNRRLGDTMELRFGTEGRLKIVKKGAAQNATAITKHKFTFLSHAQGGDNASHIFEFDCVFSGAPRSGVVDWFRVHLDFNFADGAEYFTPEMTVLLPEASHVNTQKYRSNGWHTDTQHHLDLRPASDYRLWTFDAPGVGQSGSIPDNQALQFLELSSDGGFMSATRDLRSVTVGIAPYVAKNLSIGNGYIDIWTDLPGTIAPRRVKHILLSSDEWTANEGGFAVIEGLLEGQRVFITTNDVVNSATNQGGVEVEWDSNIVAHVPADVTIVPGLIDEAVAEIDASSNTHIVGAIDAFPKPRDWQYISIYANGVVSSIPWPRDIDELPTTAGGVGPTRPSIGPVSIRTNGASGSIAGGYYVQFYTDSGNYMVNFRGSNGGQEPHAYVEKIVIEYFV